MKLTALQRQWDAWGREDPLWAAVTRNDKWGRRWDVEEFLQTGRDEVEAVLRHLGELGVEVPRARALDFGCGVGRFSQALAERFGRVDGVDISPSMLKEARRLNRHGDRCRYHLNARDDLSLFPDGSFTFVFSLLVLQHVRPPHAKRYLEELWRVLAPGGALVFQVPADVPIGATVTAGGGTATGAALPATAFQARIGTSASQLSLKAGELFYVHARLQNASPHPWPAAPGPGGLFHVQIANRWLFTDGAVHARDDRRTALPFDLQPGQELGTSLCFVAPEVGGEYVLELDMVQEGVAWFAERGSPTARIRCTVEGGLRPAWAAPALASEPLFAGFRARHPKLHGALRRAGLVHVYHASMAGARRLRDRWVRWRRASLVMEMHALPPAEVEPIIEAGGGRLLEVETERWPDGIVSARYWVVKPLSGPPGSAA